VCASASLLIASSGTTLVKPPGFRSQARKFTCYPDSSLSYLVKRDDGLEREVYRSADGKEGSKCWSATEGEQVTKGSLIDLSAPAEVASCPAANDPRPIDRRYVDGPTGRRSHLDTFGRRPRPHWDAWFGPCDAMEGTVLRVPCIPSERQKAPLTSRVERLRGFWRSSVRRPGPPASNNSVTGSRLLPCGVSHIARPVHTHRPYVGPVARRVTRMNARTRCSLPPAERTASGRVAASPPISVATRAPSPIPVSVAVADAISVDGTRDYRDVSTTSWDDLGRREPSHSSCWHSCGSVALSSIQAKQTSKGGTFQRRFGTFETSQNVPTR
jgi:hypothetical protein